MTGVKVKCCTSMTMMCALRWVAEHQSNPVFYSWKIFSACWPLLRFISRSDNKWWALEPSLLHHGKLSPSPNETTFSLFAKLRLSNL
jgi:hypothetical protein